MEPLAAPEPEPEESYPCDLCGAGAEEECLSWCACDDCLPRAREEGTATTPSDRVVDDGVVTAADVDDESPLGESEVGALLKRLRGCHAGSIYTAYPYASQVPRSVFLGVYESVLESESARSQVAVLIGELKKIVGHAFERQHAEIAATASERFSYTAASATDKLRADPEQWIRRVAPRVAAADVEAYLTAHVPDELERRRLWKLYEETRAA